LSPSVRVVIVNWNTGVHLKACLESVARSHRGLLTIEGVTVVDNASADDSATGLDGLALPLDVISNSQNLGFAAACNQGAAGSEADYLLFLNPDTRVFPDTLEMVTQFMESEAAARIGICGVQVVDDAGAPMISCSRYPTLRVFVGKMTGLGRIFPRAFPSHHLSAAETQRSGVVDQVIGAFYFVRRDLFEKLGGFDVRYFVYFEDVDFALRAEQLGARSYFLKEARVVHVANVSSDQVPGTRLFYSLRSRVVYARRHWRHWKSSTLVVLTFTIELGTRLVRAALLRRGSEIAATITGYRKLLGYLLLRRTSTDLPPPRRQIG
jgi:N-acetylglucosaminyl-diphospho-decaprenol L-rhamnosyltransferase